MKRREFLSKSLQVGLGSAFLTTPYALQLVTAQNTRNKTGYAFDINFVVDNDGRTDVGERVMSIHRAISREHVYEKLYPVQKVASPMNWIAKVHTQECIKSIKAYTFPGLPRVTPSLGETAELAVSHILGAVKDVCSGKVTNAYCNTRPAGHHQRNFVTQPGGTIPGFCCYANVVIAAKFARDVFGIQKILIIDWDHHHGDGTVYHICTDKNILFFECQNGHYNYQDCNAENKHIIILDLVDRYGNDAYCSFFETNLHHYADLFKPELILVSCGFDLKIGDGLGDDGITAAGVSRLTRIVMNVAERHCNGRIVSILEGGYYDMYTNKTAFNGLSQCGLAHVNTLLTGELQTEGLYFLNQTGITSSAIRSRRPVFDSKKPSWHYDLMGRTGQFLNPTEQASGLRIVNNTKTLK